MPLRRLSTEELNNTLRDLLGDTSDPARVLPLQGRGVHGFFEPGNVSVVDAEHMLELVESVAASAVRNLPKLLQCSDTLPSAKDGQETCIRGFLTRFGRRAFRRPITDDESARYLSRYRATRNLPAETLANAVRVVIQEMLFSVSFLYHGELGFTPAVAQGGTVRLTPDQVAAGLSYFLWASLPDDALFAAVDAGRLQTEADIERESRRMLASPKARATIARFHSQWLMLERLNDLKKDKATYPMWNRELADAMARETAEFVTRTIIDGDGTLKTLLTSSKSYLSPPLARLYGISEPQGDGRLDAVDYTAQDKDPDNFATARRVRRPDLEKIFTETTLNPAQRTGLLTHASFLAAHASAASSHPVKRGHEILVKLLCGEVRPPKFAVPPVGEAPENVSTRELFAAHGKNECTNGCHDVMDPLGFAFEHYDSVGRYRTVDGGKPVDASGILSPESGGADLPFQDAIEMTRQLPDMPDVQQCMAKQWFRFAFARREEKADQPSLNSVTAAFQRSGLNIRELIISLTTSPAFRYRMPSAGEKLLPPAAFQPEAKPH